jgi:hypothetical protein
MAVPFVGPSYNLARPASVQRSIGLMPVPVEPGNERTLWAFKDAPGLVEFCDLGSPLRGLLRANARPFAVAGDKLYELADDGTATERGTLNTSAGRVGLTSNGTQLAISDATWLYVFDLTTNVLGVTAFPGKARIAYLNQRILFTYRDSQRFGWSGLVNAASIDALAFASAEASPDKVVGIEVDHLEAFIFGEETCEPWQNTTSAAIFERNTGGVTEIGAAAEFSIERVDNALFWLSATKNGRGAVYRMNVYQPVRLSTDAIEGMFTGLDLSEATAFSVDYEKSCLYCLNVPGLSTTLVYDTFSGQWHEWAELVDGQTTQHRATCHTYAFGHNLVGSDDGKVYRLSKTAHTNAGDTLLRERTMPISATQGRDRFKFDEFWLDCERGTGAQVMMQYSVNGGKTWSAWKARTVGSVGDYDKIVRWRRISSGRDIVFRVRCTDDAAFNPVGGGPR